MKGFGRDSVDVCLLKASGYVLVIVLMCAAL